MLAFALSIIGAGCIIFAVIEGNKLGDKQVKICLAGIVLIGIASAMFAGRGDACDTEWDARGSYTSC